MRAASFVDHLGDGSAGNECRSLASFWSLARRAGAAPRPPTWDSQVDAGFAPCLLPVWRSLFLFASLANAGLPLFPDFLAEFLLLQEVEIRHRDPMLFWLTPASMLAVVLSALPGAGLAVRFLVHLGLRSRATRLGIPILVARLA